MPFFKQDARVKLTRLLRSLKDNKSLLSVGEVLDVIEEVAIEQLCMRQPQPRNSVNSLSKPKAKDISLEDHISILTRNWAVDGVWQEMDRHQMIALLMQAYNV